jgi:glutathione-regulated potassium-efflux system ancillary protein KefC
MEFIWIFFAFACGLMMRFVGLPPLIGYLVAGFFLNFIQVSESPYLQVLANIGITMMLFTIGLKLKIFDLFKPEVWVGTLGHMLLWVVIITFSLGSLSIWGLQQFIGLSHEASALIAFALSFSSTVGVMKMLEDSGETRTRHGKLAMAVLVVQDIAAVLYLVLATGKTPEVWAIALCYFLFMRPIFNYILDKAGHGEMLALTGFFFAFGAYEAFELCGIKGDLGALLAGALLANSSKSKELSNVLLNFKDIFLIGFFLSIGFIALPDLQMLITALIISGALVIKFTLFFLLFSWLQLRARTAFLSALILSNFSEFGLIVAAMGVEQGILADKWLVIIALSVSISFVFTSVAYRYAHKIYGYTNSFLHKFERKRALTEDRQIEPENAEVLVIGLGRVGRGAYRTLFDKMGEKVWGMDTDHSHIDQLIKHDYHVFWGDGEDADLWEKIDTSKIRMILLALPTIEDAKNVTYQLQKADYKGKIAAIARFEDERKELQAFGVDRVFNFYNRAGQAFANESIELMSLVSE